ncbi:MAG: GNAT family N-acetyltransferase [Clostridiales bacterium GWF2_36_10]|nr:MAG: GNAT family N-acetyltransferase [Clostridiales bacterium GWF2_36_10]HAN21058.1 N-acetyltransferase [Clostridiales bacterium]
MFIDLETDRLILKLISAEDRDFIFSQFSNDVVNRYLFDAEPLIDLNDADEIINFYIQPEPREQNRWILIRKSDKRKIGTCGFHCWNKEKGMVDVGYDLKESYWGQGYMQEAMRTIISFASEKMNISRINACISVDNQKSILFVEKSGFLYHGQMKDEIFRGHKYPHKIYSLDLR